MVGKSRGLSSLSGLLLAIASLGIVGLHAALLHQYFHQGFEISDQLAGECGCAI
jgi:hypothetical protein